MLRRLGCGVTAGCGRRYVRRRRRFGELEWLELERRVVWLEQGVGREATRPHGVLAQVPVLGRGVRERENRGWETERGEGELGEELRPGSPSPATASGRTQRERESSPEGAAVGFHCSDTEEGCRGGSSEGNSTGPPPPTTTLGGRRRGGEAAGGPSGAGALLGPGIGLLQALLGSGGHRRRRVCRSG